MRTAAAATLAAVALLTACSSSPADDYTREAHSVGLTDDAAQAIATSLCAKDYRKATDVIWATPGWADRTDADRRDISGRLLPLAAEAYCPDQRDAVEALLSS